MNKQIILASQSPARLKILTELGFDVLPCPADTKEQLDFSLPPEENVKKIAECKLTEVTADNHFSDNLVISADTLIYYKGEYIGKPKDENEAVTILKTLSGSTHSIITGVALKFKEKVISDFSLTRIKFGKMSDCEILSYVKSGEPFGKAGAYAIQGIGACFIESLEGDYFSAVGLPVFKIFQLLNDYFNVSPFDFI